MKALAIAIVVAACGRTPFDSGFSIVSDSTRELEPHVSCRELVLDRRGTPMTLWIYTPTAPPALASGRPIVLIAGAGSPLFLGMALADDDRAEHLPWARLGDVVVAYSVDGAVARRDDAAQLEAGIGQFVRAHAGLDDARAALDFTLVNVSGIDPARVIAVGHSSAATLALRAGADDVRIKAVVAMAPITDVDAFLPATTMRAIEKVDPDGPAILHDSSPLVHVAALRAKPVFLFRADDDAGIPDLHAFATAVGATLETVPTGGHYNSMIHDGIPRAAAWVAALP